MGKRTKTEAFAYLRVSSTGQLDGHGLERQEETIRRFVKGRGYQVVETFRDTHTGTEEDRPAFSEMVAAVRANGVRTVIIESLDRLARSLSVQIALLSLLEREGISLVSASTGQNVTADMREDPMREAMVLMQGIFAQTEKKLLVRKLRKARDAKRAKNGRCEGPRPYGQDRKRPEKTKIIREIRRLRRRSPTTKKQRSYGAIAAALNRQGVPAPVRSRGWKRRTQGLWSPSSVRDILRRR